VSAPEVLSLAAGRSAAGNVRVPGRARRLRRLSRREFARALRLGLGRARIDVRRHGLRGREDLLVAACLRDATRIREVEGSTARWLVEVARDGGALGHVSRAVRRAAARPILRRRDRGHVARVLEHLALAKDLAARGALLGMLRRARDEDLVEIGVPVVRALGEDGWRKVVAVFVRRRRIAGTGNLPWLAHAARSSLGVRRALAVIPIGRAAGRSRFLEAMRAAIREEGRRGSRLREPHAPPAATLEALERAVSSRRRWWIVLHRWAESALPEDRDEAWGRILAERQPRRLGRRLRAMAYEHPPRIRPGLFALARHENARVRWAAVGVLARIRDPRVRRWALAALRRDASTAVRDGVLGLLELNGRSSDAPVVAAALPPSRSVEADHDWVRGVLDAARPFDRRRREFTARPGPGWDTLLARAYDIAPCRDCRGDMVRTLVQRGSVPEWMIREAVWDSQDETRSVARRALRDMRKRRRQR